MTKDTIGFPSHTFTATFNFEPDKDWLERVAEEYAKCVTADVILPYRWWQWIVPIEFYYRMDGISIGIEGDIISVTGTSVGKRSRRLRGRKLLALLRNALAKEAA